MPYLLLIHALITFAAGLLLILSPATIPSTVHITLQSDQYLICYLLGAAEIALAFLSFYSRRLKQPESIHMVAITFIVFHLATAMVEIYAFLQGASPMLWANVALRLIISLLFAYFGGIGPRAFARRVSASGN